MHKLNRNLIDEVRRQNKITDYLSSKDINPVQSSGGKTAYLCPLHGDTNPSFFVYDNGEEPESFWCYGCSKFGDIITIYAELEHLSWKETIKALGGGDVDIAEERSIDLMMSDLYKDIQLSHKKQEGDPFGELSWIISSMGYSHLKHTNYDKEEMEFLELMYAIIDQYVCNCDAERLQQSYEFLSTGSETQPNPFAYRVQQWEERQQLKMYEELKQDKKRN